MSNLYLKLLWFLADLVDVEALDLFRNGFGDIEFLYKGKSYRITLTENSKEETTNGN